MKVLASEPPPRPRRFSFGAGSLSIRGRLLAAVWGVVTIIAALYAYLLYDTQKNEYLMGIDAKLLTGAQMARGMLGADFHDNVRGPSSVSKAEYLANVDRFNKICQALGFQYLWSNLFLEDGTIVFTSGTSTSKDASKGDHAQFFDPHTDPGAFQPVIQAGETTYSSFHNKWGDGRMVLVPFIDAQGRTYVFGASISVNELEARLQDTAVRSVVIFVFVFFIGTVISTAIASAISGPIRHVTKAADGIAAGNYGLHVEASGGGEELVSLARNVNTMSDAILSNRQDLQTMVTQLEATRDALRESHNDLERRVTERTRDVRKLTQAIEQSPHMVLITDLDGAIEYVNARFTELTGYTADEVIGKNPRLLQSGETDDAIYNEMWAALSERKVWSGEILDRSKNGQVFWAAMTVSQVVDEEGCPTHYVAIHEDITERKNAEKELRRAKEDAEIASSAKTEFLSHMSHELRTPLNAVLGFSQLLETDPNNPLNDEQYESIQHIKHSGRHLLTLIDQVLDLSKIEGGNMTLLMEDIDPAPALASCRSMAETLAQKKNITIEDKTKRMALPTVHADATRFKQILLNFLSNAIKYNTSGGTVVLDSELVPGHFLRFLVTDTGQGIPEDKRHELFQPFNRLGQETGTIEGTGIGLSISRELIQRMGGNMGFDSIEGEGSTFWFELPLADRSASILSGSVATDDEAFTYDIGASQKEPRRILYVEDNPANFSLMAGILHRVPNVTLSKAVNGETGLDMVAADRPDLILMDINLPGMDGFDVLRRLRGNPETMDIPVVAVSALAMADDIEKGLAAGFVDYLTKPIQVEDVLRVVTTIFGNSGTDRN